VRERVVFEIPRAIDWKIWQDADQMPLGHRSNIIVPDGKSRSAKQLRAMSRSRLSPELTACCVNELSQEVFVMSPGRSFQSGEERTPKVKEFVHPPFLLCPDCGEQTFGVLMVCDRHYVRRCISCWFDDSFPLPPVHKRIIYLDQFVISNMMKELNPEDGRARGYYHALFCALDRLSSLQLIVCPDSPLHDHESLVDPRYQKIRAVFR